MLQKKWLLYCGTNEGEGNISMKLTYKDYVFGNIIARYMIEEETQKVSLLLLPDKTPTMFEERRQILHLPEFDKMNLQFNAWNIGNICHLALRQHSQGNGAGTTLKHGPSSADLKLSSQTVTESAGTTKIITTLTADQGYSIIHTLIYYDDEAGFEVETEFVNGSNQTLTLDMITSFSMDNLSPYAMDDAPNTIILHRCRAGWSLEGKHTIDPVEELNIERSWLCAFPEGERYGVIGSHPVTRFFPFGAVEDTKSGITWGAQLACNSSWQMELTRVDDCYSFSGGQADCEFGAWWKDVRHGERFKAPKAFISVAKGGYDEVCSNLTSMHHKYCDLQPEIEQSLPVLFNEWCTTYGSPTHQKIFNIAQRLQDTGVKVITIDAGWTQTPENSFGQDGNGDWAYDENKFPNGMLETVRELRKMGFLTGIWFEFEVTTEGARVYEKDYDDLHLMRNKHIIRTGGKRSFWDFRKEEVTDYLNEKVINFLRDNEMGYLKVDYNGSIGIGCDGAESLGEGLREQMQAVLKFFEMIRKELPDVIIENCASGGHRLEPSMMDITAMSSFSDAHECIEIPYIAANLHHMILPRQSQIWSVINPELSQSEVIFRLTSGFLGRMCLSGNIEALSDEQMNCIKEAIKFYEQCKEIIKHGRTKIYGNCSRNTRNLSGTQAVLRIADDQQEALLICHSFKKSETETETEMETVEILMPAGEWKITRWFGHIDAVENTAEKIFVHNLPAGYAVACCLEKR